MKETIEEWRRDPNQYMTLYRFDHTFAIKMFGYDSVDDYWNRASCWHTIEQIKTPTLFFNALDDPICARDAIDYEIFKRNPFTAIATTKYGGHLGHHEGIFGNSKI